MLIAGRGRLGGVWAGRSVCDREILVGEFGPVSELLEDQAVIKLSTEQSVSWIVFSKGQEARKQRQRTSRPRHVRGDS